MYIKYKHTLYEYIFRIMWIMQKDYINIGIIKFKVVPNSKSEIKMVPTTFVFYILKKVKIMSIIKLHIKVIVLRFHKN